MKNFRNTAILGIILVSQMTFTQTKKIVDSFNKVIISPHIETIFVQGDEESVTILENTLSEDKVNIEVSSGTLRVYLDDAKITTKHKKVIKNGVKMKVPIYKGKVLAIKVTYKDIDNLSLRGEETTVCESSIDVEHFKLKMYGDSEVTFNKVNFRKFDVDIFGEGLLVIKGGKTGHQHITSYGASEVNLLDINNKTSKLKAYGEAEFKVNVSDHIKFTAYGEAELHYRGTAEVNQGLSFGDSEIKHIN
ncbi:head GIN domain-containing protein [Winogradskyella sp.]|uniref:head GIN domain-containing protein n=1 Tax=Winogradskyella sp. TaxID=1883156 RepID=UPI0026154C4D|nr:head GIN domain-containing protein [Winogradskyella sp.]